MADVFISYARADRARIEGLAIALETAGYSVWWDRQIGGGAEFANTIEAELDSAATVIVAWSEDSVGSHWVRDEAEFARNQGKLLPLTLDGSAPPLGFRQLQCIDFADWDGSADHQAFQAMARSLGRAGVMVSPAASERSTATPQKRFERPGIAILPFSNMSTDDELEFLADGLTEDVLTLLSTNKYLSVPARTSVFAFKGQSLDIREVGERLGARYIGGAVYERQATRPVSPCS